MTQSYQYCRDHLAGRCDCENNTQCKFHAQYYLRGNYEDRHPKDYLTHPIHGGKVTCHKCSGFIIEGDELGYFSVQHNNEFPHAHFHKNCYNEYEHYYGLDKPID